jgi:hypothetical protein
MSPLLAGVSAAGPLAGTVAGARSSLARAPRSGAFVAARASAGPVWEGNVGTIVWGVYLERRVVLGRLGDVFYWCRRELV